MERRKVVALSVLATALVLSLVPGLIAEVETRRVLSFTKWDLRVRAYAPYQAYPGDTIEVRVTAEALEDLYDIYLTIDVFGSKPKEGKEGYDSWEDEIRVLRGVDWEEGDDKDRDYDVEIPEDSDPGLVYGHVTAEWKDTAYVDRSYAESFTITYIMNKDYEDLQDDYAELEDDYADLSDLYDKLETDYADLEGDYTSLKADYDSVKATYDSLKSSYDSLKSEHTTLVGEKDALQKRYDSLDSEHKSLLADYEGLQSTYETTVGELGRFRTYMYALAVTTVVFVVTTIIFAVRKPSTV